MSNLSDFLLTPSDMTYGQDFFHDASRPTRPTCLLSPIIVVEYLALDNGV